jgi:hypothetical protein
MKISGNANNSYFPLSQMQGPISETSCSQLNGPSSLLQISLLRNRAANNYRNIACSTVFKLLETCGGLVLPICLDVSAQTLLDL